MSVKDPISSDSYINPYAIPVPIEDATTPRLVYSVTGLVKASIVFVLVTPVACGVILLLLAIIGGLAALLFDYSNRVEIVVVVVIAVSAACGGLVGFRTARDTLPLTSVEGVTGFSPGDKR